MGAVALKILFAYWKEIFIALVIVGAVWYVRHLNSEVDSLTTANTNLTTANKLYAEDNKNLRTAISNTNTALNKLSSGADQTQQQFNALKQVVATQGNVLATRLQQILKDNKPKTCQETIQYLINATTDYRSK